MQQQQINHYNRCNNVTINYLDSKEKKQRTTAKPIVLIGLTVVATIKTLGKSKQTHEATKIVMTNDV